MFAGAMNVNGGAVSEAFGTPSIDRFTSWIPTLDVHSAVIVNPFCCVEPFVGFVSVSVGATAPAGPNSAVMICTSFCVAVFVLTQVCSPAALHGKLNGCGE